MHGLYHVPSLFTYIVSALVQNCGYFLCFSNVRRIVLYLANIMRKMERVGTAKKDEVLQKVVNNIGVGVNEIRRTTNMVEREGNVTGCPKMTQKVPRARTTDFGPYLWFVPLTCICKIPAPDTWCPQRCLVMTAAEQWQVMTGHSLHSHSIRHITGTARLRDAPGCCGGCRAAMVVSRDRYSRYCSQSHEAQTPSRHGPTGHRAATPPRDWVSDDNGIVYVDVVDGHVASWILWTLMSWYHITFVKTLQLP